MRLLRAESQHFSLIQVTILEIAYRKGEQFPPGLFYLGLSDIFAVDAARAADEALAMTQFGNVAILRSDALVESGQPSVDDFDLAPHVGHLDEDFAKLLDLTLGCEDTFLHRLHARFHRRQPA